MYSTGTTPIAEFRKHLILLMYFFLNLAIPIGELKNYNSVLLMYLRLSETCFQNYTLVSIVYWYNGRVRHIPKARKSDIIHDRFLKYKVYPRRSSFDIHIRVMIISL